MTGSVLYHQGNRRLQDEFDSRRIADRLEAVTFRTAFTASDTAFIGGTIFFFLATADAEGRPDVSHKGGMPGFVRVTGPSELAFPDYDGNGMFKSLGNVAINPNVALLFIDFERPRRLRINGTATVSRDDPLMAMTVGAQMIVRVTARAIFPNCPRYIPQNAAGRAVDLRATGRRGAGRTGMEGGFGIRRRRSSTATNGNRRGGRLAIDSLRPVPLSRTVAPGCRRCSTHRGRQTPDRGR